MKKNLVFVSQFPGRLTERDGMMQRVKAIDSLAADSTRCYIDISFKRNWQLNVDKIDDKCKVYHLNMFTHWPHAAYLISGSRLVYVHSIYHAFRVLPLYRYFGAKIITDMHGIVPEELEYSRDLLASKLYSWVERFALKYSWRLITVTETMTNHYINKYPTYNLSEKIIHIPIMDFSIVTNSWIDQLEARKMNSDRLRVVYAGGIQPWQNVDRMLSAIAHLQQKAPDSYEFSVYLPASAVKSIQDRAKSLGISAVEIASLPQKELFERFKAAHLGFVLRDSSKVNQVAMPTKLVEYIRYGIIPIVLSPVLGDFYSYKYEYVELDRILSCNVEHLDTIRLANMRRKNYAILEYLRQLSSGNQDYLKKLFAGE
uniref:Glycosyltransferase subfamily 4-like N-terminal domain-containing protein n=1 Tax=Meiothermus ruber TaxID=277 RepID=A0A7C3HC22_MEIRU